MRQTLKVAALLFAIGLLLGYIGLTVHRIKAEATAHAQAKPTPFVPHLNVPAPPSAFQFGLPPNQHPFFDPFTQSPTVAVPKPKFAPVPHVPEQGCVSESDPCRLRQVNVI